MRGNDQGCENSVSIGVGSRAYAARARSAPVGNAALQGLEELAIKADVVAPGSLPLALNGKLNIFILLMRIVFIYIDNIQSACQSMPCPSAAPDPPMTPLVHDSPDALIAATFALMSAWASPAVNPEHLH
ncbi:MAG TPA: hypothetical protein VFV28_07960 [Limnobacter sp.]|nr:hypothetical protein [Limnobacter sp.]